MLVDSVYSTIYLAVVNIFLSIKYTFHRTCNSQHTSIYLTSCTHCPHVIIVTYGFEWLTFPVHQALIIKHYLGVTLALDSLPING